MSLLERAIYAFDNFESIENACESELILIGCCISYLMVEKLKEKYDALRLASDDAPEEAAFEDLEGRWQRAYLAAKQLPKKWQDTWREELPRYLRDVESYMAATE